LRFAAGTLLAMGAALFLMVCPVWIPWWWTGSIYLRGGLLLASPLLAMGAFLLLDRPYRALPDGTKRVETSGNGWVGWRWLQLEGGEVIWCGPGLARSARQRSLAQDPDALEPRDESMDGRVFDVSATQSNPAPSVRAAVLTALASLPATVVLFIASIRGMYVDVLAVPNRASLRGDLGPVFVVLGLAVAALAPLLLWALWMGVLATCVAVGRGMRATARTRNTQWIRLRDAVLEVRSSEVVDDTRSITLGQPDQRFQMSWDLLGPVLTVSNATQTLPIRGRQDRLVALKARLEEVDVQGDVGDVPETLRQARRVGSSDSRNRV
jgi:hypothetical protein